MSADHDPASSDPIENGIYCMLMPAIDTCAERHLYIPALILTYTGIDAMAQLSRPANKQQATREDFCEWCERYLRLAGPRVLTGKDWYGARCAVIHSYGSESTLSRQGECRQIGYVDDQYPPVRYNPNVSTELAIVSTKAIIAAFKEGVRKFLTDLFADPSRGPLAESRLDKLFCSKPFNQIVPSNAAG